MAVTHPTITGSTSENGFRCFVKTTACKNGVNCILSKGAIEAADKKRAEWEAKQKIEKAEAIKRAAARKKAQIKALKKRKDEAAAQKRKQLKNDQRMREVEAAAKKKTEEERKAASSHPPPGAGTAEKWRWKSCTLDGPPPPAHPSKRGVHHPRGDCTIASCHGLYYTPAEARTRGLSQTQPLRTMLVPFNNPDWADRNKHTFKCKATHKAGDRVTPQLRNLNDYSMLVWFRSHKLREGMNMLVDFAPSRKKQDLQAFVESYSGGNDQFMTARLPFAGVRVPTSGLANGQWHQFVLVFHMGTETQRPALEAYLDGTFRKGSCIEQARADVGTNLTVATIGSTFGNQGHLCGSVGTVLMFRRALTSEDVKNLWTNKPAG